jgi:hypothetical protein
MAADRNRSARQPLQWSEAFREELAAINRRRGIGAGDDAANLVGLAISGGGIRSATFGLGVLESLKKLKLLEKIDYLSTVSGGGFIGSWLSANCKRAADRGEIGWLHPDTKWERSIDYLRRYSKYLSPELGFFSADTWSMATIWLRNTLLVQLTIVLAMAVALIVPRPLHSWFVLWPYAGDLRWATVLLFVLAIVGVAGNQRRVSRDGQVSFQKASNWFWGLACGAIVFLAAGQVMVWTDFDPFTNSEVDLRVAFVIAFLVVLGGYCLLPVGARILKKEVNYTQAWVQGAVVLPLMLTGFLVAAVLWGRISSGEPPWIDLLTYGGYLETEWRYWPFPLWIALAALLLLSFCSIPGWKNNWKGLFIALVAPFPAALVLYLLLCAILLLMRTWAGDVEEGTWLAFVWGPSLVLYAFSLSVVVLIGMMGRESTESVREWWSRLGAWLAIYGVAWMVIAIAAVYGPKWAAFILSGDWWETASAVAGWLGTTLAGLLAGNSGSTGVASGGGEARKSGWDKATEVVAAVGPFVFIAGLLLGVSTCVHLVVLSLSPGTADWVFDKLDPMHWEYLSASSVGVVWMTLAVALAALLLLAWRVDINEFSLNEFYRSRITRCYLGATRPPHTRSPQNFTGFDEKDDMPLADLADPGVPAGPLHIVNCALNLGGSSDLALHTRHCASFTLTPYATGSTYPPSSPMGYRRTASYAGLQGHPTLGQAVSVSGAAASPNMGYHTSPVVAFLLTVFNARLGWWFPSPRKPGDSPAPAFSLRYLVEELFGIADDKSKFVMISDGGHFENLAAYELIRRRCSVVIISDGECDPGLQFGGLGTLIRMVEVDFGHRISIDVESIRPAAGSPWSRNRCAVGKIRYADPPGEGVLIYLKASMSGHEDAAILQYKSAHPAFPHESTGNQFYGEDQFESYRHLGQEVAERAFAPERTDPHTGMTVPDEPDWERIGTGLLRHYAPKLTHAGRFASHSDTLIDIWNKLDANPRLKILDDELEAQLNVAWPDEQSFRSAFLVCSQMIQLMENVYLDLDLEHTWSHPDNEGWHETFRKWARSAAMRKTWTLSRDNYGQRFQAFCERHLDL